jgi:hypothetical protein
VLVASGVLLLQPLSLLAGVVASLTLFLRRWLPADAALPVAVLGLLVGCVLLGMTAAAAGVDLLARPALLALFWMLVTGAALLFGRRVEPVRNPAARPVAFLVAQLPAAVAVGVAALQLLDIRRVTAWIFFGTDFAEHTVMLERVQRAGALAYSESEAYPRGAQTLLALFSVPGLPEAGSADLLAYDLQLLAGGTWLAFAVLLWCSSSIVLRAGAGLALTQPWCAATALTLGVLVVYDGKYTLVLVAMASAPGVLAGVAMCTVPLLGLAQGPRPRPLWMFLVTALAAVALAHLWTALLPVPLVAGAVALWQWQRGAAEGEVPRTRSWALRGACAAAAVVTAAAVAVPVLALLAGLGVGAAGIAGLLPPPTTAYLVLGVIGVVLAAWRQPTTLPVAAAVVGAGMSVAAMLLAAGGGFDTSQYYPRKAIWFLGVLVFPFAAMLVAGLLRVVCVRGSRGCGRLGAGARVARFAGAATLVAVVVAYVVPLIVVGGSMVDIAVRPGQPSEQRKLDIALEYGNKYEPLVEVPIGLGLRNIPRQSDTYVVSKFFQLKTGQPQTFGHPNTACNALRQVARGAPAVVLTDLDVDVLTEMMRRQGCPGTRIVQVPGVHPGVLAGFRTLLESSSG